MSTERNIAKALVETLAIVRQQFVSNYLGGTPVRDSVLWRHIAEAETMAGELVKMLPLGGGAGSDMTRSTVPRIKSDKEVKAEHERRQRVAAELERLAGVPLTGGREWRYDYSIDEVYEVAIGILELGRTLVDVDPEVGKLVHRVW